MKQELFDVVAVNIKTGATRLMAANKTERNAEAIINMAVVRRGVDEEFYDAIPAGQTATLACAPNPQRLTKLFS